MKDFKLWKGKLSALILAIAMIFSSMPFTTVFSSISMVAVKPTGTGSKGSPYIISSAGNLVWMAQNSEAQFGFDSKYFCQTQDIDISGAGNWTSIGDSEEMGTGFRGNYDGMGHCISGLTYISTNGDTVSGVGLFGSANGTIKNLGVTNININITAYQKELYIGGLAVVAGGNISNCYTTGTMNGIAEPAPTYTGDVYDYDVFLGGISSYISGINSLTNCYSTCTISGHTPVHSTTYAGGITGDFSDSPSAIVENCFYTGNISAYGNNVNKQDDGYYTRVGELIGHCWSPIKYCYYTGTSAPASADYQDSNTALTYIWAQKDISFFKSKDNYLNSKNYDSAYPWDFSDMWTIDPSKNNGLPSLIPHKLSTCTVSYNAGDHGSISSDAESESVIVGGSPSAIPSVTPDSSYVFTYWSCDGGTTKLSSAQLAQQEVNSDTTYTAYYEKAIPPKTPSGTGSIDDPYIISSEGNLVWIFQKNKDNKGFSGKVFKQTKDIDISNISNWNSIGDGEQPFCGTYDGTGHIINGLSFNGDAPLMGLFGQCNSAALKDFGVTNININDIVVNSSYGGCFAGGIVGLATSTSISDCYSEGAVSGYCDAGETFLGGIVGESSNNDMKNCYANCSISTTSTAYTYVGGLAGTSSGGTMTNCFSVGKESANGTGCYVGDLAGTNMSAKINNCYYIGTKDVGFGTTKNCSQKDAAFFKAQSNFTDSSIYDPSSQWDFTNTWKINGSVNNGYPSLIGVSPVVNYTVTYNAGAHGSISGSGSESVASGGKPSAVPTVTPDTGYVFDYWSNDGGTTKLSAADLAAQSITGDVTYTVYYKQTASQVTSDIASGATVKKAVYATLTSETGATIYYEIGSDPANPTTASKSIANGEKICIDGNYGDIVKVKAYAVLSGKADSQIASFTYTIQPKATLTIAGVTAQNKPYDGNRTASLSGTPSLNGTIKAGDDVTISGTSTAVFDTKDFGTNKTVTVTGYSLTGKDAQYYDVQQPSGLVASIGKKDVNVEGITVDSKVYDGNVSAILNTSMVNFAGKVDSDELSLDISQANSVFNNPRPGTNKTVTVTGLKLGGKDSQDYNLKNSSVTLTGTINSLGIVATPVPSPRGSSVSINTPITILCQTVDAAVYYTTDGTMPTVDGDVYNGQLYTQPIIISSNGVTIIKAIAVKNGETNSDVMTERYVTCYNVSFNTTGGNDIAGETVDYGNKISKPADPILTGYTFAGWYKEEELKNQWDFDADKVTGPTTLYAKWTVGNYTLNFDSQGGSSVPAETVTYMSTVTKPADPAKTGYTFGGWYKEPGCITPWSFDNDKITVASTVYAKWVIQNYTVNFDSQGGSAVPAETAAYMSTVAKPADPAKNGDTFGGWYKEPACVNLWDFDNDKITVASTVYAKWVIQNYAVNFDSQGGSLVPAETAAYMSTVAKPTDPTKNGDTFGGWYKEPACVTPWNFDNDKITVATTVYAKWNVYSNPVVSSPVANNNDQSGVQIKVNNDSATAATVKTETQGNLTKTVITLDDDKVNEQLGKEGNNSSVIVPVSNSSDIVEGTLNGETVKNMEGKNDVLELKTDNVTYVLPAKEINIDDVSSAIGTDVKLKDIKVSVSISKADDTTAKVIENTASSNSYSIVVKPVEFQVTCTHGDQTVSVSRFNSYVERLVAIPDGVDPSKITTGIVLNSDGTFSHVPTFIEKIDGKYYAKINSLTNSTYSVIYNPETFADVSNHWAKDSINNMASRLIINGTGDGKFEPDRYITRAEFAQVIVKGLGLMRNGTGKDAFADVKKGDWYYDAVSIANDYKLINGTGNGNFSPNDKITREEAMAIIARAMKLPHINPEESTARMKYLFKKFTDSTSVSTWAQENVAECIDKGIIQGKNKAIDPKANITRAEVATIITRLLQKAKLIN